MLQGKEFHNTKYLISMASGIWSQRHYFLHGAIVVANPNNPWSHKAKANPTNAVTQTARIPGFVAPEQSKVFSHPSTLAAAVAVHT